MRSARLTSLVDTICGKPFESGDAVLYHWDISENNVLINPNTHQLTGLIAWEQLRTTPLILVPSRYPSIMARECDFPDFSERPAPPTNSFVMSDESVREKSNDEEFWERQKMREAFDRRLAERESPWLRVGKDSKDEVEGQTDTELCQKCHRHDTVTLDNRLISISELAQVEWYC